jgi:hypothetical protein
MSKIQKLVVLTTLVLSVIGVANAADPSTYSWADLNNAAGSKPYAKGKPILLCNAAAGSPDCRMVSNPPADLPKDIPCFSAIDPSLKNWIDLGTIPGVVAMLGNDKIECNGLVIPAGQWWGKNTRFQ